MFVGFYQMALSCGTMPDTARVLTVQHALTLEPLLSAIVKAGAGGLNAPIRAVHVLEQPELTPWVRGGELLLSTGLSWNFSDDEAKGFVQSAARLNVSALLLATGRFRSGFTDSMLKAADTLEFPLIELPFDVPFVAVSDAITLELLLVRDAVVERADLIHRTLSQAAVFASSVQDLSDALSVAMQTSVVFSDLERRVIAVSHALQDSIWQHVQVDESIPQHWQSTASHLEPTLAIDRISCAVRDGGGLRGALWVQRGAAIHPDLEARVVVHAATVFAVHLAQVQTRGLIEARLGYNVVDALLEGLWAGDARLQERARLMGFHPTAAQRVVLIVPVAGSTVLGTPEGFRAREALAARVGDALDKLGVAPLLTVNLGRVIALIPDHNEVVKAVKSRLHATDVRVVIGSSCADPSEFKPSLRELERLSVGGSGVVNLDDLTIERMLGSIADSAAIEQLLARTFDLLKSKPILQRTLEALIETGFHQSKSAAKLGIHWNTLKYRLSRLETLLDFSANDPQAIFGLTLAAQVRRIQPSFSPKPY